MPHAWQEMSRVRVHDQPTYSPAAQLPQLLQLVAPTEANSPVTHAEHGVEASLSVSAVPASHWVQDGD